MTRNARLVAAALLAVAAAGFFSWTHVRPPESGRVAVVIPEPATIENAARILEDSGVIASAEAFLFLAKSRSVDPKPGRYIFLGGLYPWTALRLLERGVAEAPEVTITFPEGLRLEQFAEKLEAAGITERQSFLKLARDRRFARSLLGFDAPSLEGYLFPNTYRFRPGSDPESVLRRLHQHFRRAYPETQTVLPDTHSFVTLASIVEREAKLPEERPRIAAVFLNRLAMGIPLAADPTIRYALNRWDTAPVLFEDLESLSPYNTYKRAGLPPGPISSVGEATMHALANPIATNELYFVARGDGSHIFARTFSDHRANILRVKRERAQRR